MLVSDVGTGLESPRGLPDETIVRAIRVIDRTTTVSLALLGLLILVRIVAGPAGLVDWLTALAVLVVGAGLLVQRRAQRILAARERATGVSFTRLMQGLARSASPDAIVTAIVDALRGASGADHVIVARLRPADRVIEATLVSASLTVPPSRTTLPADLLVPDPGHADAADSSEARREVEERLVGRLRAAYGLRHTLDAPLLADGAVIGVLLLSRRTGESWTAADHELLESAAGELSVALARVHAQQAAETRARIDALTGLPNRRHFDELASILTQGRRVGDALGVLMIDIDHFKKLNDRHGHAAGDAVLREVGRAIAGALRSEDTPCRYGGEEFAVILRRATLEQAVEVAQRIHDAVAEVPTRQLGIEDPVSVSVGVAVGGETGLAVTELVERADRALYAAKRRGRDRVVVDETAA
ncbi:MAG: putative sensor protein [Chloroflexi bacterium CSP1-4]|nr:MAG: putative sensor protein [Chloroflexi bacterium CSP1-4]